MAEWLTLAGIIFGWEFGKSIGRRIIACLEARKNTKKSTSTKCTVVLNDEELPGYKIVDYEIMVWTDLLGWHAVIKQRKVRTNGGSAKSTG